MQLINDDLTRENLNVFFFVGIDALRPNQL